MQVYTGLDDLRSIYKQQTYIYTILFSTANEFPYNSNLYNQEQNLRKLCFINTIFTKFYSYVMLIDPSIQLKRLHVCPH